MSIVICEQRETEIAASERDGEALWIAAADVERATGWTLKPEGLCRGETCIPLSPSTRSRYLRGEASGARVDLVGLWRSLGHPVVGDAAADAWVLGIGAAERQQTLQSLEAPDFALTDLEGRTHTLSAHRGRKVLLATWASW